MGWDLRFHSLPPGAPITRLLNNAQEAGTRISNNIILHVVLLLFLRCLRPYRGPRPGCREQGILTHRLGKQEASERSRPDKSNHTRTKLYIEPRDCHVLLHKRLCCASQAARRIGAGQRARRAGRPGLAANSPHVWLDFGLALGHGGCSRLASPPHRHPQARAAPHNWKTGDSTLIPPRHTRTDPPQLRKHARLYCNAWPPSLQLRSWNQKQT